MHSRLHHHCLSIAVGLALLSGSTSPLHTALAATRSNATAVPTLACGLSPVASIDVLGYTAGAPLYVVSTRQLYRMQAVSPGWTLQHTAASDIQALAPDPRAAGALLYVSGTGVYRSSDGGVTATRVGASPAPTIATVIRAASAPNTLYAVSPEDDSAKEESRIYRSDDNGTTWRQVYIRATPVPSWRTSTMCSSIQPTPTISWQSRARIMVGPFSIRMTAAASGARSR